MKDKVSDYREVVKLYREKVSIAEIARRNGVTRQAIFDWLKNHGFINNPYQVYKDRREEKIKLIKQYVDQGLNRKQIAEKLGINYYSLCRFCIENNIKKSTVNHS